MAVMLKNRFFFYIFMVVLRYTSQIMDNVAVALVFSMSPLCDAIAISYEYLHLNFNWLKLAAI